MATFDWSFARLTVPVAVTFSIMVSSRVQMETWWERKCWKTVVACDMCRWQNSGTGVKYRGDTLEDDDEISDNRFMKSLRLRDAKGKKLIHMYSVTGGWSCSLQGDELLYLTSLQMSFLQCSDTVGWVTVRASGLYKVGCWFVGGDDLIVVLDDL